MSRLSFRASGTRHAARRPLIGLAATAGVCALLSAAPVLAQNSDDIANQILNDLANSLNDNPAEGAVVTENPDGIDNGLDTEPGLFEEPSGPDNALTTTQSDPDAEMIQEGVTSETVVVEADGAILRGLDKVSGETTDIPFAVGETRAFGYLTVTLDECRYPQDDPSSNAYAFLTVSEESDDNKQWFRGWMIANAPALNPLDHPRYDVWVLRCRTEATSGSGG